MNLFLNSCYIILVHELTCTSVSGVRFSAITDEHVPSVSRLYFEEGNPDPPSALDKATTDPSVRRRICRDVTQSGAFSVYGYEPVSKAELTTLMNRQNWPDILGEIYDPTYPYVYTNPLTLREMDVMKFFPNNANLKPLIEKKKEHVFICLLKDNNKEDTLVPLYVSKEYDAGEGLKAHRFAFFTWAELNLYKTGTIIRKREYHHGLMIIERSAELFQRPDFEVELHYLKIREKRKPADTAELDPVCKSNTQEIENYQFFRHCAIVFSALYFKEKYQVIYPRRVLYNRVFEKQIGFKTIGGKKAAGSNSYSELMLECSVNVEGPGVDVFFVSRAYNSHQVFVYREDKKDGNHYLEGLFTGVSIVHEQDEFGFPPNSFDLSASDEDEEISKKGGKPVQVQEAATDSAFITSRNNLRQRHRRQLESPDGMN